MLLQLNVKNLATLASVDLELTSGCIAVTGDTGAGKSLILDALELALAHALISACALEPSARRSLLNLILNASLKQKHG